jgi:DNA polymerase-3 subunit epsilon
MREIILDTETTGLDPFTGDRLVEIAGVEVLNYIPTGETFHVYIDPQRDMPVEAFNVHGLSEEFLRGKPLFSHVVQDFLAFIGDSRLVIHNAEFDMRFINHELKLAGLPPLGMDRVLDTLAMARRKHPGAANSLDALCSRYRIDNSRRVKHGALLDAEILAEVYAELVGGRQATLILAAEDKTRGGPGQIVVVQERTVPLGRLIEEREEAAHRSFLESLGDKAIWKDYLAEAESRDQVGIELAG